MRKLLFSIIVIFGFIAKSHAATTDVTIWGSTQAITINTNSQSASATSCQQSAVIDNTVISPKPIDDYVVFVASTSNSALGSSQTILIYVSGAPDGVNFDHDTTTVGGGAGSYTVTTAPGTNLKRAATLNAAASGASYVTSFQVAQLFGGALPPKMVFIVCNDTNQTTAASGNFGLFAPINYGNQ